MMIKEAAYATVFTLFALFAFLWLVNLFKQKNTCPICGDSCQGDFCCDAHELLHYDEEEFSREEMMDAELDEALAEQEELERQDDERWERLTKCLP